MADSAPNPWSGAYGKVVDAWSAALLTPAFALCLAGFAMYASLTGWTLEGLADLGEVKLAVLALGLLLLSVVLGEVMDRSSQSILRGASGYWWVNDAWGQRRIAAHKARLEADEARFQQLTQTAERTPAQSHELSRLSARLNRHPVSDRVMPTALGNVLRAAEDRPLERYGLDPVPCWPRLWILLPDAARTNVKDAYASLILALQYGAWGFLLLLLSLGMPLLLVLLGVSKADALAALVVVLVGATASLLVMAVSYTLALRAAETYGNAFVATFDVHRDELYKKLRWPLPRSPREELTKSGPRLSAYLWGSDFPRGFTYEGAEPEATPEPDPPAQGQST